jgi:ATP-binding cassette subfamily B protein
VDTSTEGEIKRALSDVLTGRTTFVIAHRLSTISLANRIIVLEDGQIVADGTHDDLLEQSELFREIVESNPIEARDRVFLTGKPPEAEVAAR